MVETSPIYFVSIPGTEQTRELDQAGLQEALKTGEITSQYWVWSPAHEDWKQIADLPEFQRDEAPKSRVAPEPVVTPAVVKVSTADALETKSSPRRSLRVEEEGASSLVTTIFLTLAIGLGALAAFNYLEVQQPFHSNLAKTPFASVSAYAHLGSFVQPQALVVHVPPNAAIKESNLPDFLQALAQSTPVDAISSQPFKSVSLTPAWTAQYAFASNDWQALAQMGNATTAQRKDFIIGHVDHSTGQPMVEHPETMSPQQLSGTRAQVWQDLVASFASKS